MNVRNMTIALIALPVAVIIVSAVVVREVQPRLSGNMTTGVAARDAKAATESGVPSPPRGRVRSIRADRDSVAIGAPARRPVSVGRLTPVATADDSRWQ